MSEPTNIEKLVEAIGLLEPGNEEHFTKGGVPSVEALEAVAGVSEVTAAERDEAWEAYQAANPSDDKSEDADVDNRANAKAQADAETARADKATADLMEAAEASKKGFFVEEGKSITSRKGVRGPGDRVTSADIAAGGAGTKALSELVKKGIVKEVK